MRIKLISIYKAMFFFLGINAGLVYLFFQSAPAISNLLVLFINFSFFALSLVFFLSNIDTNKLIDSSNSKFIKLSSPLIMFVLWQAITIYWSPVSREVVWGYYIISFCQFWAVFIFLLCSQEIINIHLKVISSYVFAVLVLIIYLLLNNEFAGPRLGSEEFLHPNTIGNLASISIILLLGLQIYGKEYVFSKKVQLFVLLILVSGLILSFSKTSIVALFCSFFVVTLIGAQVNFKKKIFLMMIGSIVLLIMFLILKDALYEYVNNAGNGEALSTYSGRTVIWLETIEMIMKRPVLGYGFMSFREIGPQVISLRLVHPHNELLNILFLYGGIGLLFYISSLILLFAHLFSKNQKGNVFSTLILMIFIYSLIKGGFEANVTSIIMPLPLVLFLLNQSCLKVRSK